MAAESKSEFDKQYEEEERRRGLADNESAEFRAWTEFYKSAFKSMQDGASVAELLNAADWMADAAQAVADAAMKHYWSRWVACKQRMENIIEKGTP